MKKFEITDALASLWVLVRETEPVIIGSQALHGKFPDVADLIEISREVDVILPNKSKLGNWLFEVVGQGTPFDFEHGYYIDHVVPVDGLPILADGWQERSIVEPLVYDGKVIGQTKYLSPEDMAISKLAAGREKDFSYIQRLIELQYIDPGDVKKLLNNVPVKYVDAVQLNLGIILNNISRECDLESESKSNDNEIKPS